MLTAREALSSLYGAYRLARFDAGGMAFFDTSIDGFWRSFFAAAIVAPFYAVLLTLRFAEGLVSTQPLRFAAIEAIAYVIAWVAFPLVMVSIARLLDREDRYLGYIVAYNWAAVLQNALYLPLAILAVTGGLTADLANTLAMIALLAILIYTWFITKTAMALGALAAAALVALDLILSIFINSFAEGMI